MIHTENKVKRIVLFAHFDWDNVVDNYVLFYLRSLRKISDFLIFISTSSLDNHETIKLDELCDHIIIKENTGYDFMSWKTGCEAIPDLSLFDELVICNDSVYGALFPFQEMFNIMSNFDFDFWGITDSYAIQWHLQSYFIVFKKNVFSSKTFMEFFEKIKVEKNKEDVIKKYEIGLSQNLIQNNFKAGTYIPEINSFVRLILLKLKQVKNRSLLELLKTLKSKGTYNRSRWVPEQLNKSILDWKRLVKKYKMPVIKIELLRTNPGTVDTKDYDTFLKKHTSYDTSLIKNHLHRMKKAHLLNTCH